MSSFPMFLIRCRTSCVMVLAGVVALSLGNGTARSQLMPSATGSQLFLATDQALAANGFRDITIASAPGASGLFDASGVVYLANGAGASTVSAQFIVNGQAQGTPVLVSLAANSSTTIAVPQQFTGQPVAVPVILRISNGTTGSGVTVNAGSGLTVTGYALNGDGPTASVPGSYNQTTNTAIFTGTFPAQPPTPPTVLAVANVGGANSTGLFSLNSAITVINNNANQQTVSARYTVDGTATGPTFQMTLPAGAGSTTLMALPTQLSLAAGSTHTIGINITDNSGLGISVKAGSTISATAYNTSAGVASAVGAHNENQLPIAPINIPLGGTAASGLTLTVPTSTNNTFYDVNASFMLLSGVSTNPKVFAQYTVTDALGNATPIGQQFSLNLATTNNTTTFSLPEQFAAATLIAGRTLGVQFSTPDASATFTIEADSITLIAHQQVPTIATPEPASLSLAAMAALAFGGAAYRKRRKAEMPV